MILGIISICAGIFSFLNGGEFSAYFYALFIKTDRAVIALLKSSRFSSHMDGKWQDFG